MNLTKLKVFIVIAAAVIAELFVPAFGYSASAGDAGAASVSVTR